MANTMNSNPQRKPKKNYGQDQYSRLRNQALQIQQGDQSLIKDFCQKNDVQQNFNESFDSFDPKQIDTNTQFQIQEIELQKASCFSSLSSFSVEKSLVQNIQDIKAPAVITQPVQFDDDDETEPPLKQQSQVKQIKLEEIKEEVIIQQTQEKKNLQFVKGVINLEVFGSSKIPLLPICMSFWQAQLKYPYYQGVKISKEFIGLSFYEMFCKYLLLKGSDKRRYLDKLNFILMFDSYLIKKYNYGIIPPQFMCYCIGQDYTDLLHLGIEKVDMQNKELVIQELAVIIGLPSHKYDLTFVEIQFTHPFATQVYGQILKEEMAEKKIVLLDQALAYNSSTVIFKNSCGLKISYLALDGCLYFSINCLRSLFSANLDKINEVLKQKGRIIQLVKTSQYDLWNQFFHKAGKEFRLEFGVHFLGCHEDINFAENQSNGQVLLDTTYDFTDLLQSLNK